jgi:hypothetical protein
MNQSIFELAQEKCLQHELILTESGAGPYGYTISNWERSKTLDIQIITPEFYLPEKKDAPYDIETACTFNIPSETFHHKPDFLIFCYQEELVGKTSFLIVQTMELLERFEKLDRLPESDGSYRMTIYAGPDDYIMEATEISGEGEWYFFGGRMATRKNWDFSMYLNQWDVMFDYFRIPQI